MNEHNDPKSRPLLEEGAAYMSLSRESSPEAREPRRDGAGAPERFDVLVIGGGQAGLSVGYHLARRGLRFAILDASERIGDSWRNRWDSLRLFTPARYDGLDGYPFPAPADYFPTKDEMADYLESYAERFELPVRSGTRVRRLSKRGGRFVVTTSRGELEADQVVVAMASYQRPRRPDFAADLRDDIVQLHSSEYEGPSQLTDGDVLIVGAGNSGAEIAKELAPRHRVWLSGRDVGQIPFRPSSLFGRLLGVRLVLRVLFHRILTIATPIGRKARPEILSKGGPLIRVRRSDLVAAGVEPAPKTAGSSDGLPRLEDGRVLDVRNVIWCTGYHPGFSWIDLDVFDERGQPTHRGGVVESEPGLYFVGLNFLYSLSSTMIHGVGRDAARIVDHVARRSEELPAPVDRARPAAQRRAVA